MFKKLKERIESVDENAPPRRPPGLAVRSPPAESETKSFIDNVHESEHRGSASDSLPNHKPPQTNEDFSVDPDEGGQQEEVDKAEESTKEEANVSVNNNASELQSLLTQLSGELTELRDKYDTIVKEKEGREEGLRTEVIQLEAQLDQRNEAYAKMESKVSELTWSVESLTSRLQLYSAHDENETVKRLQKEVSELNKNLRERNLEIEILETRISAQSRKHHDEQTTDSKTIRKLQEALSTLQAAMKEQDSENAQLVDNSKQHQRQLSETVQQRNELEKTCEEQKKKIASQAREISQQRLDHALHLEQLKEQHEKQLEHLEAKLQETQTKLKDKEQQLERIVTELPDQPITKAVLDGYSRTKMAVSFSNKLLTPGLVLKRETDPLVLSDGLEQEEEPAILPIENDVSMETEYEYSQYSQAALLNEVRSLKSENEQLAEEIVNKDQTIRVQQQKISDMRKALSKGLKPPDPPPQPPRSLRRNTETVPPQMPVTRFAIASDVNFQYLKNVVVRFICSREEEASQLLRAVSTLLELSSEEEKYVNDYLQYKMSWFGTMPSPPKISIKNSEQNRK